MRSKQPQLISARGGVQSVVYAKLAAVVTCEPMQRVWKEEQVKVVQGAYRCCLLQSIRLGF